MTKIELCGSWNYRLDETDEGHLKHYETELFSEAPFLLPGSACDNKIGKKQEYYKEYSKEAVRAPRERYEYIAPLWLQREVVFPEGIEEKRVRLFLERVNIASELWLDGQKIGRQIIELSTPHVYDLTGKVASGKHTLTLCIDNRNLVNMGDMASGYSIDTQGYWNGIIGEMAILIEDMVCIDQLQVYPKENGIRIRITILSGQHHPLETKKAAVCLSVTTPDGQKLPEKTVEIELFTSRQNTYVFYELENISWWSEFHPDLYELSASIRCGGVFDDKSTSGENIISNENIISGGNTASGKKEHNNTSCKDEFFDKTAGSGGETVEKKIRFGMRIAKVQDKKFFLNGHPLALRGTIDCAQTPLTGYPPMDKETWLFRMRQLKKYGLNHMRFHAWCPPETAFAAADECGIYLSVEMPLWLNRDVTPLELGDDPIHYDYYRKEVISMLDAFGNHPSFLLFSNGNENMGDFAFLEELTLTAKAYDGRQLYTMTSNFDHILSPFDDYFCASDAYHECVRIQHIQDKVAESTSVDFQRAVELVPAPIVTFEVGQYCVYPDVDIIEDYTGNMLPVNFDVIRKEMEKKGVYDRRKEYVKASGAFAARLYKEDIEAVLRTKGMGGFELLSLTDYTGQSTATVGILDVMYRDKQVVSPEDWRSFCCEVVPLFMAKRIYSSQETLEAGLALYQAGEIPIEQPVYDVRIVKKNVAEEEVLFAVKTTETTLRVPLSSVTKASLLQVTVRVEQEKTGKSYENHWQVYCYPQKNRESKEDITEHKDINERNINEQKNINERNINEQKNINERSINEQNINEQNINEQNINEQKVINEQKNIAEDIAGQKESTGYSAFKQAGITVASTEEELRTASEQGGLCLATQGVFREPIESGFIPVFWSPVHFPSRKPCGAIFKSSHPVFADFPTGEYPDYQWKELLDHAKAVDINLILDADFSGKGNFFGTEKRFEEESFSRKNTIETAEKDDRKSAEEAAKTVDEKIAGETAETVDGKVTIMAELVPNFVDNTQGALLFEAVVGKAKVLFCGFDLLREDLPTAQLKQSILEYMTSDAFSTGSPAV